jgi:hypothetical protein
MVHPLLHGSAVQSPSTHVESVFAQNIRLSPARNVMSEVSGRDLSELDLAMD